MKIDTNHLRDTVRDHVDRPVPGGPRFDPDALPFLESHLTSLENLVELLRVDSVETHAHDAAPYTVNVR